MVKNTHGGSGHKKFARKYTNTSGTSSKLRVSECHDEMYAIVKKMCGNNMVHVFCIDGGTRLCRIRGKFTGRRKKDNFISLGSWVMVGLHEYDDEHAAISSTEVMATATAGKKVKLNDCDLLEVYSSSEKEQLKNNVEANWEMLILNDQSTLTAEDDLPDGGNNIKFTTEYEDELEALAELIHDIPNTEKIGSENLKNSSAIDIDCI